MNDGDLLCNFKKCRKILTEVAFITRCSHAFCEEDATREIDNQNLEKKCPACQTPLVESYDLVKVVLNPSEQFKSMVLAGLRPEHVMDIATRAITFWTYQLHQELFHQKMVSKNFRDVINRMKSNADIECGLLKSEVQALNKRISELEKEVESKNQKCIELHEKLTERTREVQKWQMNYESLRRKQLSEVVFQRENNVVKNFDINSLALNIGPKTMDEILAQRSKANQVAAVLCESAVVRFEDKLPAGDGNLNLKKADVRNVNPEFNFQPRRFHNSPKIYFDNTNKY